MNKVVLLVNTGNSDYNAGPKAQVDICKFLCEENYSTFTLNINNSSLLSKLTTNVNAIHSLKKKIKNTDEIIIQYPMSKFTMKNLINMLRKKTQAKIYCIIHDIESLRINSGNKKFRKEEISLLNKVDGIIVHNNNMLNWLKENGLLIDAVTLNLFDYNNPQPLNKKINYSNTLCFAGNLSKSSFLKNFHPNNLDVYLFGSGLPNNIKDSHLYYKGAFSPNDLPKYLTQSYGLVWDGNSVDSCKGVYGEYLKYNAPHKVSLYLSSGLPVIVWKNSGVESYITKHNLGIAVESLPELDNMLLTIDYKKYKKMKENCIKEADKLRKGYFIKKAVEQLEKA